MCVYVCVNVCVIFLLFHLRKKTDEKVLCVLLPTLFMSSPLIFNQCIISERLELQVQYNIIFEDGKRHTKITIQKLSITNENKITSKLKQS